MAREDERLTVKIHRVTGTPAHPVEHHFEYANTYVRERLDTGVERLRIGLRGGHSVVLRVLGAALAPPYRLLYLLHTTGIGAPLGRYESPDLDGPDIESFSHRFGRFLAEDARHDVWLHSMTDEGGTLVLDRFNMVYAFGPLEKFERILDGGGIQAVAEWAAPQVPYPHALHYHREWDAAEREILEAFEWQRTPLHSEDVQFWSGPQAT
ncbi:MAG TPA: hypothetical protein VFK04_14795 [Gemmatimonadaceae bacterium]|nr:hypothetical protein [Gemmatimonadaceae bacterium]